MTRQTKKAKAYVPTAEIKAGIASVLKLNTQAVAAEKKATTANTKFIIEFYKLLKSIDGMARKYALNFVLGKLDVSKAKWIKALINKLLKDDGELQKFLVDNPSKTAEDFIKGNQLGEKERAEKFQTRKRQPAAGKDKKKITVAKVPEIEAVKKEIQESLNALDYLDPVKVTNAFNLFITTLTKLHHADSGKAMLGKLEDFPTAEIQKMF